MRVGELSGDVELEVIMVGNHSIPKFDHQTALLLECLCNKLRQTNTETAFLL